jgi:hypothetical protein
MPVCEAAPAGLASPVIEVGWRVLLCVWFWPGRCPTGGRIRKCASTLPIRGPRAAGSWTWLK